MAKNKGKGGKNCKRGKNKAADDEKRELEHKQDGQEYAQIVQNNGDCRYDAMCIDGIKRTCRMSGHMKNKARISISTGDIVLVRLCDYEDNKAELILKYTDHEARKLKEHGELPQSIRLNEGIVSNLDVNHDNADNNDGIVFEDDDIEI